MSDGEGLKKIVDSLSSSVSRLQKTVGFNNMSSQVYKTREEAAKMKPFQDLDTEGGVESDFSKKIISEDPDTISRIEAMIANEVEKKIGEIFKV